MSEVFALLLCMKLYSDGLSCVSQEFTTVERCEAAIARFEASRVVDDRRDGIRSPEGTRLVTAFCVPK